MKGAGHHVYADQMESFNKVVNRVCDSTDDAVTEDTNERVTVETDVQGNGQSPDGEIKTGSHRPDS